MDDRDREPFSLAHGAVYEHTASVQPAPLITPYGGRLRDLLVPAPDRDAVRRYASQLPSVQLSERALCDLELLATGAFSPLDGFMGQQDYHAVLHDMRLRSGHLCPIPVTLAVDPDPCLRLDRDIALRDAKNNLLAVMTIEEIYPWDQAEMARAVCGTVDPQHPLVAEMHSWGGLHLAGPLRVLQLPQHYDFRALRLTPAQTRARLAACGYQNVVAFHTRQPLHRVHEELTKRAVKEIDGALLLHPTVGLSTPGDVDHYARVRAYQALTAHYYDLQRTVLALLPLAPRLVGPREALWHALIRRNYGANYLIVGHDYADPGAGTPGTPFYAPYDAQALLCQYSAELGVGMIPDQELLCPPDAGGDVAAPCRPGPTGLAPMTETPGQLRLRPHAQGLAGWFTRPEVAAILDETYPPRHRQGFCVWFTGLSGAGKSTTAEVLNVLLLEYGRQITVLDGDVVRTHLSRGLGFDRADRDLNIRRIGYVAAEIVRHGGVVLCAAVSPYRATRNDVRHMVGAEHFVEVFVDTALAVCEERDVKGMYAKARRGEIKDFTGIDDPYEPPLQPDLRLDTVAHTPEENAHLILQTLIQRGFVRAPWSASKCDTASTDYTAYQGTGALTGNIFLSSFPPHRPIWKNAGG